MPIITIYQGASDQDREVAEFVARALGYPCVGREVLVEASRQYGIPEARLDKIVETGQHWWTRLLQDLRPYKIALQAALCAFGGSGKLVYHGHLGHEMLPGIGHVLKVLLTAPIEYRIEEIRARQNLTESAARYYVEQVDKARSRRLMAMFGTDWTDSNRYDLVLNMAKMSRQGAARVILEAAKLEEYQPAAASMRAFNDLALGCRVHATLLSLPELRGAELEVCATEGHVHIGGRIEQGFKEELLRIVEVIPGVTDVTTDVQSASATAFLTL